MGEIKKFILKLPEGCERIRTIRDRELLFGRKYRFRDLVIQSIPAGIMSDSTIIIIESDSKNKFSVSFALKDNDNHKNFATLDLGYPLIVDSSGKAINEIKELESCAKDCKELISWLDSLENINEAFEKDFWENPENNDI